MNYYSRNSPVKNKRNPPPGFLIPTTLRSSSRSTPSTTFKSQFNLSRQHSPRLSETQRSNQSQMLILDDDRIYVPDSGEILIQQDQQDPLNQSTMLSKPILQKSSKQQQEQQIIIQNHANRHHKIQQKLTAPANIQQQPSEQVVVSNDTGANPLINQNDKQIPRNYSFGNKQFDEFINQEKANAGLSNQPLIRKIVNIQLPLNQPKLQKQIKKNQKDNFLAPSIIMTTVQPQQNWNKLVKNFIKKRQSSKESELIQKKQQSKIIQISEQSLNNKDQQQVQSNETGYFGVYSIEQKNRNQEHFGIQVKQPRKGSEKLQDISKKYQLRKSRKISQQIHIQQEQQPESSRKVEDHWIGQLEETDTKLEQITFNNSTSLLQQTIKQLPKKLVPTYLKIHEELVRRQLEAQITLKRMHQTQQMIKMLIISQKKYIYVDDLLLTDFTTARQERIAVNQEIIFSLVRKLAALW